MLRIRPVTKSEIDLLLEKFEVFLYARKGLSENTVELYYGIVKKMIRVLGISPTTEKLDEFVFSIRKTRSSGYYQIILVAVVGYQWYPTNR